MRVGLIGLGNIGQAMLTAWGGRFPVTGCDLAEARRADAKAKGAAIAADAAGVALAADLIVLSLPDGAACRAAATAMGAAVAGKLVIETSTVLPSDMEALHTLLAPHGARLVEAAIAGGVAELAAGRTTFLAAGDDADLDQAKPVLDGLGRETIRLGPRGAGMGAKVIVNAVVHAEMVVLIEALALARRIGLSGAALAALLERPAGLMRPLTHRVKERILKGDFSGGMSTANARKDSRLALALAAAAQVPVPLLAATDPIYELGVAAGFGAEDYAALAKLWEGWIGAPLSEA